MVTREKFVAEARTWLDVRWLHQGRNRHGVDCIGLVLVTCWALGLTDYDVKGYGRTPNAGFLQRECDRMMTRVREVRMADVLLMRYGSEPQHMGIVTDRGVIHAYAPARRVVETDALPGQLSIVAAYTVPGVV